MTDEDFVDRVKPGDEWQFNESVAKVFDDMLERSIPSYLAMRELTFNLGKHFCKPNEGTILDLGASRGEALRPFIVENLAANYVGWEISSAMRTEMESLYADRPNVAVREVDLRNPEITMPINNLTLSILTLQFVPTEFRPRIVQMIYDALTPGGAFIFVEKCISPFSLLNEMFIEEYHAMKQRNGYSYSDIEAKRASLENVMVSVPEQFNLDLMRNAGFHKMQCFYRHLNFAGWIAVK